MLIDIQLQGAAEKNASRGNDLAQTRAANKSSQGQKELFKGECSNHPQARNFVSYGIDAMRENEAFCQRLGGEPNCGVGPSQGYRAQRGAVDNAAGRPNTSPVGRNTQGASNGNNVAACLTIENRSSAISTQSLVNTCNHVIEATWCFEGGSPSDSCSREFRNLWTIRSGATYPLQSKTITQLKVGACRGSNTLKITGPLTYDCAER